MAECGHLARPSFAALLNSRHRTRLTIAFAARLATHSTQFSGELRKRSSVDGIHCLQTPRSYFYWDDNPGRRSITRKLSSDRPRETLQFETPAEPNRHEPCHEVVALPSRCLSIEQRERGKTDLRQHASATIAAISLSKHPRMRKTAGALIFVHCCLATLLMRNQRDR